MATVAPRYDPSTRLWTAAEFAQMGELGLFGACDVELVAGTVRGRTGSPFVFTRKDYYALDDNHFFRGQRVQLIGGAILEETAAISPRQATAIQLASRSLGLTFRAGFDVRCRLPIDLGQISEPNPDLSVVSGSPRDYLADHPKAAFLAIEVSESTIEFDAHEKASLYASGGIEDYWVIDLTTDRVLVFRSPCPDPNARFGHDYASLATHSREDKLSPLAAPAARILGSDLLP